MPRLIVTSVAKCQNRSLDPDHTILLVLPYLLDK